MTSHKQYVQRVASVNAKIVELKARLAVHADHEAQNPKNWGYSGDMGRINELLDELLANLPMATMKNVVHG